MKQSDWRNNPSTDRPRVNWPSAGQIIKQLIIVAVVVAIWAAGLVAYLEVTGGPDKVVLAPNTPTPTPTDTPQPTFTSTVTPTPRPTDTPTVAPTAAEATASPIPAPTQEPSLAETAESVTSSNGAVSFAADVLPMFGKYCLNCHGSTRPRVGLSLASYDEVMAGSRNGPVVTPGDAEASLLVKVVISGEMPPRGDKPKPSEIQILVDWLNAGAPNN